MKEIFAHSIHDIWQTFYHKKITAFNRTHVCELSRRISIRNFVNSKYSKTRSYPYCLQQIKGTQEIRHLTSIFTISLTNMMVTNI